MDLSGCFHMSDGQTHQEGEYMKKRLWVAGAGALTLALHATALYIALPTHAASSNSGSSPYTQPRWWAKYQVVSAVGFKPTPAGKTNASSNPAAIGRTVQSVRLVEERPIRLARRSISARYAALTRDDYSRRT
jgi:hypothetical protein